MNRNIFTAQDIVNYEGAAKGTPQSLDTQPPAGATPPGATQPPGVPPATADDYLTRLVKYIPPEVIGAYLLLAGLIQTNLDGPEQVSQLKTWLGVLLIVMALLTIAYDRLVLGVIRKFQIAMSVIGLVVYVFVAGDWFATLGWYQQWYSTFALVGFGFLVLFIKLPELPMKP